MIEANDISDELADGIKWKMLASKGLKSDIALVIREAIEAGLVSPPVWICRTSHGELLGGDTYTTKELAHRRKWESDTIEHWKGQTS